jgi:peptidoglycan hydrolase CwlO-like protein
MHCQQGQLHATNKELQQQVTALQAKIATMEAEIKEHTNILMAALEARDDADADDD